MQELAPAGSNGKPLDPEVLISQQAFCWLHFLM
jgi:hypothetical protein